MRIRREVIGACCALLITACAAASAGPDAIRSAPSVVDGVGVLPQAEPSEPAPARSDATVAAVEVTTLEATTAATTTGTRAAGNRVLLIGDSILASTSRRYTNDTCNALVPLGWRVEVEAEVNRRVVFGNQVLARRMSAGWDVGVVFLGSNDGAASEQYLRQLDKIVTTFAPRPVVLVTVSEFKPGMIGINDTIRAVAATHPDQVSILDWAAITAARPEILHDDGVHPTTAGRQVLAEAIAAHLGPAPTSPGECLRSVFTDDSAGSVDGTGGSRPSSGTSPKPRPTVTTSKPSAAPTTSPGSGTGTSPPPTTGSTAAPPTAAPPTTAAPTHPPPTVAPPPPPTVTVIPP